MASGLKLDLTRGKPASAQLDLSDALLALPTGAIDQAGVDTRNYGGLEGIAELRAMFADLLWVEPEQVVAGGNSSLVMMREVLTDLWLKGGVDSERPWSQEEKVTFICPVPGYDRHFTLLDWFGIEMVTVPMNDDGPDPDAVAELAGNDPSIKGIWVVPTYANPSGSIVTQEVAERLASMRTAAPDFKILWDNAYAFHHLTEDEAKSADILILASAAGHPHRPIMFASTSKITYAGAGVAFLAGSVETVTWYTGHLGKGAIGPDKLNQLRHAQFFGSAQGVRDHMARAPRRSSRRSSPRCERARRAARRPGHRDLDRADRRLLRQPRRAGRHRGPGGRARQGRRHRADPGGLVVPLRPRPATTATSGWRPTFPEPAEVERGDGRGRHLRACSPRPRSWTAEHRRAAARPPELPKAHLHLHFTGLDAARHPARARRARRHPAARRARRRVAAASCRPPTRRAGSGSSGSTTSPGRCCAPRTTYAGWCSRPPRTTCATAAAGWRSRSTRAGTPPGSAGSPRSPTWSSTRSATPPRRPASAMAVVIAANRTRHPLDARTLARLAAQYAGRGVVGFGLSNDERRGSDRRLRPALSGSPSAPGCCWCRTAASCAAPSTSRSASTPCTPTGSATASASAEDPALLDRVVARASRSRSARSPTSRSASTPT